jgi:glycerol-3-phosphate acyltransferase PlsY
LPTCSDRSAAACRFGRLRGVDIRELGSRQCRRYQHALRTQGWQFALAVHGDRRRQGCAGGGRRARPDLPFIGIKPRLDRQWLAVACAIAVVVGHVYPLWYEFRGGKGAATLIGAVAVLAPAALVPVLAVWLATVMLTGFVGLGTMLASLALPVYFALDRPIDAALLSFGVLMAAFVIYTHRANVARMRAGNESRARRLWLLRPR